MSFLNLSHWLTGDNQNFFNTQNYLGRYYSKLTNTYSAYLPESIYSHVVNLCIFNKCVFSREPSTALSLGSTAT